ncbi:hypothetical protein DFH11DRAFT_1539408 [Phellopilus nigrolimitatus]|nr:hypothetical protein DFH11DRAFT_1539408 [Phellopilus nigrolimitatus]
MSRGDNHHVRALLDQRAQRADIPQPHTRFSTFSDRSDSPSLYSHFDTTYRNTPTTPAPRFSHFNDSDAYDDHHAAYPPQSHAERLVDPHASTLDLSEVNYIESASRIADLEDDESNLNPADDEDPEMRMSMLGPKMRVHSRAPWEEDDGSPSDSDSGNDNLSVFGGKKPSRAVMRGLGFRSKSPAPRPSFDSSTTSKGRSSFETVSGVAPSNNSRNILHPLTQASMSSSSLALGSSPSSRLPLKPSVSRLAVGRDRSLSAASGASDKDAVLPALPSPRSAISSEHASGRQSPLPHDRNSVSPQRSEFSCASARTRPVSPNTTENGVFIHPYANPALLSTYNRGSVVDPFKKDGPLTSEVPMPRNDSVATLAASEGTVMHTHSSSVASVSVTSTSGLDSTTPPTSAFSLVSAVSQPELSKAVGLEGDLETARQKRSRRETKLGPISAPAMVANNDIAATTSYTLISLEQAQARVRSATTAGVVPFPVRDGTEDGNKSKESASRVRSRTNSATGKVRPIITHIPVDDPRVRGGDIATPLSATSSKQPSPSGPPTGRVIRPKRSGFMKLFNGREKDKGHADVQLPPVPPIVDSGMAASRSTEQSQPLSTPRPLKVSTHRVPVPTLNPTPPNHGEGKDDARSKKSGPSLSIKIHSPPTSHAPTQEHVTRRSDSPKSSLNPLSPRMATSAPAGTTQFAALKLRPVSTFFSSNFAGHLLSEEPSPESPRNMDTLSLISPTTIASSDLIPSPINAGFNIPNTVDYTADRCSDGRSSDEDQSVIIAALKEQIRTSRKAWQRQIWELEGQVRDLKAEIDEMKAGEECEVCGRGNGGSEKKDTSGGVIHRPRAKTGCGARFASGNEG